jgi:hypothetical protein
VYGCTPTLYRIRKGKDRVYVRCAVSGPLPISRGPHGGVILAVWTALTKDRRPAQSVEPDTGQEWQPTTHRSHGDSAAFDEV